MSQLSFTCEEISPMLDAYHDGELDQSERSGVASHLSLCGKCQAKLSEIGNVVSSLKNLPRLQMPHDLTLDAEFMRRAMAIANATSSATNLKGSADTNEKVGGELKAFPIKPKAGSAPLLKKIFPLPGPVILASTAAAAALALVVIVPRYLNTPATNAPTLANLPKANNEKFSASNHGQNIASEIGHNSEIRAAHNAINQPAMEQASASHLPVRAIAQGNENNVPISKESHDIGNHATNELASARVPLISQPAPEPADAPAESTGVQDNQVNSHTDPVPEERDAQSAAPEQGELLALYPGDNTNAVTDELAIPTDEDGLYALKL
jgi:anti-sigma factor RsiW